MPRSVNPTRDTDVRPTASTLHTPIRVEMFRGRVAPRSRSGLQTRGLTGKPAGPPARGRPLGRSTASPDFHSMFKTTERKESRSTKVGVLADNRPTLFDAKKGQMVSQSDSIQSKPSPFVNSVWCYTQGARPICFRAIRPRRDGRAAECGAGNGADFLLVLSSRTLEEPMHEAKQMTMA